MRGLQAATGLSTYSHPADSRYRELLNEAQDAARRAALPPRMPLTEEALEVERQRLRQASAAMEREARRLREEGAALQKEVARAALSINEQDEIKAAEWQAEKEEALKQELAALREDERQNQQSARDKMEAELREQLYVRERAAVRAELLAEEKERLAVERLRLRQRIVKEETEAVRERLEAEEGRGVEQMREEIRAALRQRVEAEEENKIAQECAAVEATPQSKLAAQEEARERQAAAARARRLAIEEQHRAEVAEYAAYLGMDPIADESLLWIAEMALTAPLPAGWSEHTDPAGNVYFFNAAGGGSTYEHPLDASFKAYYLKVKSAQGGLSSPERADGKPA
mgnify:CR=1 FL=1|jgi:hypothetical protein